MEVPDKLMESTLSSISGVLLEREDEIPKDKKLKKMAKSYSKLLALIDKDYEHDYPFFKT